MLEKFIEKNREQFDDEIPGLDMWAKIDEQLHPKPRRVSHTSMIGRVAASLTVLVVIVVGLMFMMEEQPHHLNEAPIGMVSEKHPEFNEMQEYYSKNISKQMSKLAAMNHNDIGLLRDIEYLESSYDTLLMEWQSNPHVSDERIINALVVNLRMRNELLNTVVHRIEEKKKWRRLNNESEVMPAVFHDK